MRTPIRYLVLILALTAGRAAAPAAQTARVVRGTAVDRSGGVLPGVSVVAAQADGRQLDTTVTNASGEFSFAGLPAGAITLVFHLDGFEDGKASVTVPAAADGSRDVARVVQQLELVSRSEVVTVHAEPPAMPPPAPRPVLEAVPAHDQDSVCGPAKAEGIIQSNGTVRARRNETVQGLFGPGDELLIDGGVASGLGVGQNYIVRRRYETALADRRGLRVMGEHSSGLLQIVSVDAQTAVAVVVYACDAMMTGDYLVPFQPDTTRDPESLGAPTMETPARVLFADAGQLLGVARRKMVIDRGARQGVRSGQRLQIFRKSRFRDIKPTVVGEAVVVAVRRESATIRIEWAQDVVYFGEDGDWVVTQPSPATARAGSR